MTAVTGTVATSLLIANRYCYDQKLSFSKQFLILKSRDSDANNHEIQDKEKQPGFGIPGLQCLCGMKAMIISIPHYLPTRRVSTSDLL